MSISEIFFSQNWILSLIFLLLIITSISSWYVIFYKILFFRAQNKAFSSEVEQIQSETSKSLQEALLAVKDSAKFSSEILDRKLNIIFEELKSKVNFGQTYLASVANLTPFIGLFGTVLGVYFALIDISQQGNASIATVAGPIGEALIATAIGLWCAIPAAFAYNYFSKKSLDLVKKIKLQVEKTLIEKN